MQTREDAKELQKQLLSVRVSNEKNPKFLNSYFKPLDNITYKSKDELEKCKAYGIIDKSWIRLYAVRVNNSYVITGGAIKLTKTMMDRQHTRDELKKLDECLSYLRSKGIFDEDGLKN